MSRNERSVALEKFVNPSDLDRFWSKVLRRRESECWPWLASTWTSGYGQFTLNDGGEQVRVGAHVYAYRATSGKWPDEGHEVCHRCDNPQCCNGRHLFEASHGDNVRDASRKGRLSVPRPRRHKVTAAQIEEIRQLVDAGELRYRVAERYGISKTLVTLLLKGPRRQYDAPLQPRLVRKAS